MSVRSAFYNWLARKYGWGEETFKGLDEEHQASLLQQFNEIRRSYGQEIALMSEVKGAGVPERMITSFSSETRMIEWFQKVYAEADRNVFEEWLRMFFERGGEVYVDGEPCGYWACWGAGVLGERPVAEKWELDLVEAWTTGEIKNRIWSYVDSRQPIPGSVSLLSLRIALLNRGEDPHGYHNT